MRLSLLLTLLVTLAACSSSRPVAPAAVPPPAANEAPAPAADPAEPLDEAPDDWFRRDDGTDRLRGVSVERAYGTLLSGRTPRDTVVVAVIDSGVDVEHEDLDDVLWINRDEIPGNGVDDDANGYVDDVHGWNFIGGADGRNVGPDTYELTRLVAALAAEFDGVDPATLTNAERERYARYETLRAAYDARVAEMEGFLGQAVQILDAVEQAEAVLADHLGKEDFTMDEVAAVASPDQGVQRARQLFLYLDSVGATPEMVVAQRDYAKNALDYGYNLEFDPRGIVGDDPSDLTERVYGNADVTGPDAEHGTHVAGIIAAERGNGVGIDGIASAVRIMVVRAVPDGDERDKDVANGIRYAVDNGADIINMSFGKAYSPQEPIVEDAIRYAERSGVLLVHAAGNDADDLDVTDNYPNAAYLDGDRASTWITVGASSWGGPDNFVGSFSNFGRTQVDVFAPGVDIYSTVPGSEYAANSGTSMAAPVVSGVAALVKSYFPELTAAQLRTLLMDTAVRYPEARIVAPGGEGEVDFSVLSVTGGIVNAYEALQRAAELTQ